MNLRQSRNTVVRPIFANTILRFRFKFAALDLLASLSYLSRNVDRSLNRGAVGPASQ